MKQKTNLRIKLNLNYLMNKHLQNLTFHKPVTDKIESTKQVAIPENKPNIQPAIENTISKYNPFNILNKGINPALQAKI